ncbi:MAG: hypothetical protein ACKV2T_01075 [Kofleriaceae bacterium]
MKLDWDDLRDELDRSDLDVDISPISVAGHPAVVVVAPIAPMKMADSLRALLLAKDLDLGSITVTDDHIALRHVLLTCGCTKELVLETAKVLVHNANLLAPAILSRPSRPLVAMSAPRMI